MLYPVIIAGGSGSRLWPLSRELYPKQFLNLLNDSSLLQQTLNRIKGLNGASPLIICNEEHRFLVAEQLRQSGTEDSGIILEPVGRNTAPAIALAALHLLKESENTDNDPILLILPADHFIENEVVFKKSVNDALPLAESGHLVTFGIVPTAPETAYGYIKRGVQCSEAVFKVESFVEKPDLQKAKAYLDSGEYYWNSGIFMFKASSYIEELETHAPEILANCIKAMSTSQSDMSFVRVDKSVFEDCPSESIDYAVMEPVSEANGSNDLIVVPMDAGWNDVGSWSALWDVSEKDSYNNVHKGDVFSIKSSNNFIYSDNKLIATLGIDNLVVVETEDAILVADKSHVQEVKHIVKHLRESDRKEYKIHREVYRPWGKYDSVDFGPRYQVKRITVNPGQKLSIQKHFHRSEHWVVVGGSALVTKGEDIILVTEDQSTYIPLGTIHALENPGSIPLEIIEIQTGSYLGEDDIVRYEDRYGRV